MGEHRTDIIIKLEETLKKGKKLIIFDHEDAFFAPCFERLEEREDCVREVTFAQPETEKSLFMGAGITEQCDGRKILLKFFL